MNFTLEGCRNNGGVVLPNGDGDFICDDSAYTTGNLGKGWNELDLVPYRLTADAGNSAPNSQTYSLTVVLDREDAGNPGYDVLSVPKLNAARSDALCTAPTVGVQTDESPGLGGADRSIFRLVTITQPKKTKCVYDYYGRLALGSHDYPGSSLHANLANETLGTAGIGSKEVSIPVKEILPQELSKDMAASQGSDHVWNITKRAEPARLTFDETCGVGAPLSKSVAVTVEWQRLPATSSGDITVVTNIYAENPASRTIAVQVTDRIRAGTTVLDTATSDPVDVPANTKLMVLTHTTTVPAGSPDLNDVASATYSDKITGVAVPGITEATASAAAQASGVVTNATATVTDVESITGANLEFSIDSVTGASGSFAGGYTLGTRRGAGTSVSWTSAAQSGNGSVTFGKTVYVTAGAVTSGTLADTATLTGSNGFSASADTSTEINASASVSLTINKRIPNVLRGAETATFDFEVWAEGDDPAQDTPVDTASIFFSAGQAIRSATVSGLETGVYFVTEKPAAGWNTQPASGLVDLSIGQDGRVECSGSVDFTNDFGPASAKVIKVTDPAGSEEGWTMCLSGPKIEGDECVVTDEDGEASFETDLSEGDYTVTEESRDGWRQESSEGCSFSVDYPSDQSRTFTCTFRNEQLGRIIIEKVTDPSNEEASFDFTLTGGPSGLDQSFSLHDGQSHNSGWVQAGSGYAAGETLRAGWDQSLASCDNESPVDNISVAPGATVTCTFLNTERGAIIIKKETVPEGADQSFDFTLTGGPSNLDEEFSLAGGQSQEITLVEPGDGYVAAEDVPAGWDQTSATCDDASPVGDIDVSPGEVVTCTFTNTAKPNGMTLDKKVNGGDHASIGDALLAHEGDPLTYTVVITNTGQVPLTITALSDSLYAGFAAACPQGVGSALAVGASFTCTYPVDAAGDAHNVAVVDAVDSLDRPVADSDETYVDVIQPAISIVKTANPEAVSVSGPVTYTYVVTNTGDTMLFSVLVVDDVLGAIGTLGELEPGESVTMAKTVEVDASTPPTNIGTALGTDVLGKQVTASDDAVITVVLPQVLVQAELPRTGAPLQAQTRAALFMIQVGVVMILAGRRRRSISRAD